MCSILCSCGHISTCFAGFPPAMATPTVFTQVLSLGHHETFHRCVARYHGDACIKTLSCYNQRLAMAFAQLTARESLRDLEAALGARRTLLYQINGVSRPCSEEHLGRCQRTSRTAHIRRLGPDAHSSSPQVIQPPDPSRSSWSKRSMRSTLP